MKRSIMSVLIAMLLSGSAFAPDCNWGVFERGCNEHSTACAFLCAAIESRTIVDCYTDASDKCCKCVSVRLTCQCPWGNYYAYDDRQITVIRAVCLYGTDNRLNCVPKDD